MAAGVFGPRQLQQGTSKEHELCSLARKSLLLVAKCEFTSRILWNGSRAFQLVRELGLLCQHELWRARSPLPSQAIWSLLLLAWDGGFGAPIPGPCQPKQQDSSPVTFIFESTRPRRNKKPTNLTTITTIIFFWKGNMHFWSWRCRHPCNFMQAKGLLVPSVLSGFEFCPCHRQGFRSHLARTAPHMHMQERLHAKIKAHAHTHKFLQTYMCSQAHIDLPSHTHKHKPSWTRVHHHPCRATFSQRNMSSNYNVPRKKWKVQRAGNKWAHQTFQSNVICSYLQQNLRIKKHLFMD